jgi:hypothetical protein
MGCGASRNISVHEPCQRDETASSCSPADSKSNGWGRHSLANSVGWNAEHEILTPYMDDVWRLRNTILNTTELREFSHALSYGPRDLQASITAFCKLAGPPGTSTISIERLCRALEIPDSQNCQNPLVRRFIAAVTPVGWGGLDFKTFAFCQRIFKASHQHAHHRKIQFPSPTFHHLSTSPISLAT